VTTAAHFIVGTGCNKGCRGCLWTRRLDGLPVASVPPPVEVAGRSVRLAGREPTLRSDLAEVVAALRSAGTTGTEIETNGRMFGYPRYLQSLRDAGVTRLAVKLFGCNEGVWDAHTRAPGSFKQTLRAIDVIQRLTPRIDLVAVIVPRRDAGAGLREMVDFARELNFKRARLELRLAKLDLTTLPSLAAEISALRQHPPNGLRLDVGTA
jgi:molybdenum cofactor biosynthesis enzyme MoaA